MSYLNITRNTFLEKEELKRFQQFLADGVAQKLFLENTSQFGIVQHDFVTQLDFKILAGTNPGTLKLAADAYALDLDGLLIYQKAFDNMAVPNDSQWYWVKASHEYTILEEGTLSIDADGVVSGVGTIFTDVCRGQSTDVPVKIQFIKSNGTTPINDQVYEIVNVTNDTGLILTGSNFSAESDLKYSVVGTTPVSEAITAEQLLGLYHYDSCKLELKAEEVLDTPPTIGYVDNKTFYLARVRNVSNVITVQDKRTKWWTFNIPGLADKLDKNSNLSELTDKAAARNNLDVYSKAEIGVITAPVNNHQQVKGVTKIVGAGSGAGIRTDMADMTITYTPEGTSAMIMFSAAIKASVTVQTFNVYIVKDGVDLIGYEQNTYQQNYPFVGQFLVPVTKGVSTTIKIAWRANSNFEQDGTKAPRVLTIIDLP